MERERRSREYWEQELSEYWDSGLTVQEYSELKELPYESVRRWIRRLKQERPENFSVFAKFAFQNKRPLLKKTKRSKIFARKELAPFFCRDII